MKIKFDFSALLASVIVLYCNGGISGFFKGSSVMTIFIYGILFLWFALFLFKDRKHFSKYISVCVFVIVFIVLVHLFVFALDSNLMNLVSRMRKNILFLLMFVAICIYYSVPERKNGRRIILCTWVMDTAVSSVYTIYRLIEMPTLSRILATESPEKYLGSGFSIAGVLGFGSIYGLVFVITAIIGLMKKVKPSNKVLMIGLIVLFTYTIIQAQFFIAAVLCVLGILMAVLLSDRTTIKKIIGCIVLFPLLLLGIYLVIKELLPKLVSFDVLPYFISERLKMFLNESSMEALMVTSRSAFYLKSVSAIISSYGMGILFVDTLSSGGHSEILDLVAIYGIPLAAVLMYGIWQIKKLICRSIPADMIRNYNIVWVLFLLMSIFNTSLWCQTTVSVFLTIPLAYMELRSKTEEVE